MLQEESLFTAIHSFHISLSILIFTNLPSLNDVFDSQAFCLEISFDSIVGVLWQLMVFPRQTSSLCTFQRPPSLF